MDFINSINSLDEIKQIKKLLKARKKELIRILKSKKQYNRNDLDSILYDKIKNRMIEKWVGLYWSFEFDCDGILYKLVCGDNTYIRKSDNRFYCLDGNEIIEIKTITHEPEFRVNGTLNKEKISWKK